MSYTIRCYTLFDITNTGVLNRKPSNLLSELELAKWQLNRNRQANFDTVVQVISLRSQPENISSVVTKSINFKQFENFGFLFEEEEDQNCFQFDFTITHKSVFDDGIGELGALYTDCEGVPMIKCGTEWEKLPLFLDSTPELRNIYFEVITHE
jgi:hypothetical protein